MTFVHAKGDRVRRDTWAGGLFVTVTAIGRDGFLAVEYEDGKEWPYSFDGIWEACASRPRRCDGCRWWQGSPDAASGVCDVQGPQMGMAKPRSIGYA